MRVSIICIAALSVSAHALPTLVDKLKDESNGEPASSTNDPSFSSHGFMDRILWDWSQRQLCLL
ncbi:hypothetical protein TWF506_006890 [Arthrobotrys conoides]|uniref:Uncharacterized protein n=1 Tax=Arthrobotrys conoides TaxID=74498 RepID=A0AAN8NSI7_9PEZI